MTNFAISVNQILISFCQAFEWNDVYVPKGKDAKFCYFNRNRNSVEWFETDSTTENTSLDNISSNLVKTVKVKTYLEVLKTFLERNIPFSIIGPSGSGTR